MKRSERFICPPPGEDKRRYLWWARRVLEECDAAVARMSGGTAQAVWVSLFGVPKRGLAYVINEFHASGRHKLLGCAPGEENEGGYRLSFISPVGGELFSSAAYEFPHSFEVGEKTARYVYGGSND